MLLTKSPPAFVPDGVDFRVSFAKPPELAFPHLDYLIPLSTQVGNFLGCLFQQRVFGLVPIFVGDVFGDLTDVAMMIAALEQ